MRARIYNKSKNTYYISEVYAIINKAGDWYVVDDLNDKNKVVLVEYLDFESNPPYDVNVEIIDANRSDIDFIYINGFKLDSINSLLTKSKKLHYYRGPQAIWKHRQEFIELLENGYIEKSRIGIRQSYSTKLPNWNYVETEHDINYLMEEFAGFCDSVIKEISYIPGDYVDEDDNMHCVKVKKMKIIFNSQQTRGKGLEMILLSPRIVQIVPPDENYFPGLYDASIFIEKHKTYFYNSYMESIPENYEDTYFVSMGMMWRLIGQTEKS